jgi:xylan 1,4-beta-xylosidase
MVLLGVRPRGGTPGWHVIGRETYLAPVTWDEGRPVIGPVASVMTAPPWPGHPAVGPPARDEFDQARLHPYWVSVRSRPAGYCSTGDRPGWLTLRARGESLDDPDVTFVGRR